MWIYRYLRVDNEEIDVGPFPSKEEAQKTVDMIKACSASVAFVVEVPDDYKLFNPEIGESLSQWEARTSN